MPRSPTAPKIRSQSNIPQSYVRDHLRVLGTFFQLIQANADEQLLDEFFQRSTYRLQLWVEKIISTSDEEQKPLQDRELPPLDVALALHSLMLSPRRYFEDSMVRFKQLKRINEYPLSMILAALDVNKMGYDEVKCHLAAEYWRTRTGFAFDAIESMRVDTTRSVQCPFCGKTEDILWNGARGFAQAAFEHKCPKCHELFTHDTLRAGKFLQAVNQAKKDRGYCLPNTSIILGAHLDVQARCPAIVDEVSGCFENSDGQFHSLKDLAMSAATARGDMMTYIAKKLTLPDSALRPESIPLLLRAFEHSYPFTQDVTTARWFIEDVYRQGWAGGPSDEDLDMAYDQYNDFLERSVTVKRRDPQWRDDLIWHTHQLMPDRYRADIASYIHVFLDHLPRGEGSDGYGEDIVIVTAMASFVNTCIDPPNTSSQKEGHLVKAVSPT
ncbi:hypothetical protein PC9H_004428 [Pleurotus ostreatus]|uniref:Uncharacterized protein n=1 Tax=Pleurotus ostreatus TaxID=5322 RepID=A0A8H7DYX7_PLEOS|nr:uncharacterized protein PC9H_004428 [Pleurotus ostreatus]KAF7437586.1 hypothetical protein PC9H_004428 [Pleurotus ostreatus]